jgi:putative membrane protein
VPWYIGPAYLATGYLAWIVATTLLADVHRNSPWLTTIVTPIVGAVAMTSWDLAMDPNSPTINQWWIWENGGGFFGVPLVNFLGWTLTVYLYMQACALICAAAARRHQQRRHEPSVTFKQSFFTRQRPCHFSPPT